MASSAAFTAGEALVLNAATNAMRNSGAVGSVAVGGAATSNVALRVGGSNALWVASNAAVGIGTTAPSGTFHIQSAPAAFVYGLYNVAALSSNQQLLTFTGKDAAQRNGFWNWYQHVSDGSLSNSLRWDTNGADHILNLRADGNVGIGTASPAQKLVVQGNMTVGHRWDGVTSTAVNFGKPDASGGYGDGSCYISILDSFTPGPNYGTSMAFITHSGGVANTEKFRISANGNIGIGTASPSNLIHLHSTSANTAYMRISGPGGSGNAVGFELWPINIRPGGVPSRIASIDDGANSAHLAFSTAPAGTTPTIVERMRIFNNGTIRFVGYGAGTLVTNSSGDISVSSDSRVKQNIEYLATNSLQLINQLKPASYELLSDVGRKRLGFIAQDVETVIPDAVDGKKFDVWYKRQMNGDPELDENGNLIFEPDAPIRPRSLDTTGILAHAVKAIQELSAENTALKAALDALTARVTALESRA